MTPTESVVLCEGVHDRAFWKGWLEHLGCRDARPRLPTGGIGKAVDPFGKPVEQGQFAFVSPSGAFVRVRPCNGDKGVLSELKKRLEGRMTNGLLRLVVGLDIDADVAEVGAEAERIARIREGIEKRVTDADPCAIFMEEGDFALDGRATLVSMVLWSSDDRPTSELPASHTLERLVCSALRASYPERATAVATWLASRPSPPAASPKEHAWSHMAGWYARHNCDDFYQDVWRDPAVASALKDRLRSSGAWRIAESLAK
jgi:hypothetical protein